MDRSALGRMVENQRFNAAVAWALVLFVLLVAAGNLAVGEYLWAGFASVVAVLALVPPAVRRSARAMLPFEVLALAILPLVGRTFASVPAAGRFASYLSVAALALMVAVELHMFTEVEMSVGFAVFFVVVATMATAGVWAVVRWIPDVLFGTTFLLEPGVDPKAIEHELMWEFVWSTVAGVVAGIVFEFYFRRRSRAAERLEEASA